MNRLADFLDVRLHICRLVLVCDQDTVPRGGDDHVLRAADENRHVEFVDDIHILARIIKDGISLCPLRHHLRHRVPRPDVLPLAGIAENPDGLLLLCNGIVKTDLREGSVFCKKILIIAEVNERMRFLQKIRELKRKNSRVPESAPFDIVLCSLKVRLFPEFSHHGDLVLRLRNDIAVFFGRIGRLDSHQREARASLCRIVRELFQFFKIGIIHVRVDRAHDDRLLPAHMQPVMEKCRCQSNRRKSVPPHRLDADGHVLAQLVPDRRDLRLCGRNRHTCIRVRLADLPVYALHHRLITPVRQTEQLNKLLRAHIIRERPEPFAGAAGQQNNIHNYPPIRGCRSAALSV